MFMEQFLYSNYYNHLAHHWFFFLFVYRVVCASDPGLALRMEQADKTRPLKVCLLDFLLCEIPF